VNFGLQATFDRTVDTDIEPPSKHFPSDASISGVGECYQLLTTIIELGY